MLEVNMGNEDALSEQISLLHQWFVTILFCLSGYISICNFSWSSSDIKWTPLVSSVFEEFCFESDFSFSDSIIARLINSIRERTNKQSLLLPSNFEIADWWWSALQLSLLLGHNHIIFSFLVPIWLTFANREWSGSTLRTIDLSQFYNENIGIEWYGWRNCWYKR